MIQKLTAYAIVNGTLSRYEYYKGQSDEGGYTSLKRHERSLHA